MARSFHHTEDHGELLMLTGAEVLLIHGGLNAAGTILGLGNQYTSDKINKIVSETNARLALEDAKQQAAGVARQGAAVAGGARAAMAASGVTVSADGTPGTIERQIEEDTQRDIYETLLTGQRVANEYRARADAYKKSARDAVTAGAFDIGGTVFGTARGLGKWMSDNPDKNIFGNPRKPA